MHALMVTAMATTMALVSAVCVLEFRTQHKKLPRS